MKLTRTERAQMAMMLEVCAHPKPGNVDRCHDYDDTWLEHFLSSAILVRPALEKAEKNEMGIGPLIREAVRLTSLHNGGNTHFGAYILLFPLVAGDGIEGAIRLIRETTVEDAVAFYEAFSLTSVRANETDELDVNDPASHDALRDRGMTLYDVMAYSASRDMVCREWTNGFVLTRRVAEYLLKSPEGRVSVPAAFMDLLSTEIDTFIVKKLGEDKAQWTRMKAKEVVLGELSAEVFDMMCLSEGVNPGSIADIVIAGIYLALSEGWEWDF